MIIISSNFTFSVTNFHVIVVFLTKLLTLGILLSTVVRAAIMAKLLILGVSSFTSLFLVLREALVAKLVISGIASSIYLI